MSIVIFPSNGLNGSIGYENHVLTSTITASSEAIISGVTSSRNNLKTWTSFNSWQASNTGTEWVRFTFTNSVTADYMGMFAHNMANVGTVQFQYSIDDGSNWVDLFSSVSTTRNEVIYKRFTGQVARDWRVLLTQNAFATDAPSIAVFAFGNEYILPRGFNIGFQRPGVIENIRSETNESVSGLFLGRSIISAPQRVRITQNTILNGIVQDTWKRFQNHAFRFPFFFSWDNENHPDEAVYAWTTGNTRFPRFSSPIHEDVRMDINTLRHL